jgi:hypothetical protein
MRIFKNKDFAKWASKDGVTDVALKTAVNEIEQGLVDVNLGGGVIKKAGAY